MEKQKIVEAMTHLDAQLIQEAAQPVVRRKKRLRSLLVAACLTALCVVSVAAASSGLLVKFYSNRNLPENIPGDKVDAYYEVSGQNRVALSAFSEELLDCAREQGPGGKHYPFETLEEIEAFLGSELLENAILEEATPIPVKMTGPQGEVITDTPGSVLVYNNTEGNLVLVKADYYCRTQAGRTVFLTAAAATERNHNGSIGSQGVDYAEGEVLQQRSEDYQTASGQTCTIVSTQNSITEGWDVYSWFEQDGFVLGLSLTGGDEAAIRAELQQILDGFQ